VSYIDHHLSRLENSGLIRLTQLEPDLWPHALVMTEWGYLGEAIQMMQESIRLGYEAGFVAAWSL
jgi:hypothetical protein